jgi:hypothetical protein
MLRTSLSLKRCILPISIIIVLSLIGAVSAYYRGLWEGLVFVLIPVTGIVASIYGALRGDYVGATLVAITPYIPPVFLGRPIWFPLLGIPMVLMGVGSVLARRGIRSAQRREGFFVISGILLLFIGFLWWLFILARLFD